MKTLHLGSLTALKPANQLGCSVGAASVGGQGHMAQRMVSKSSLFISHFFHPSKKYFSFLPLTSFYFL